VQIKRSVALRDNVDQRWGFDVGLSTTSLDDDLRWFYDSQDTCITHLLGLSRVGNVRTLQFSPERSGEANSKRQDNRSSKHCPRRRAYV
jgi:hypothetical protein